MFKKQKTSFAGSFCLGVEHDTGPNLNRLPFERAVRPPNKRNIDCRPRWTGVNAPCVWALGLGLMGAAASDLRAETETLKLEAGWNLVVPPAAHLGESLLRDWASQGVVLWEATTPNALHPLRA